MVRALSFRFLSLTVDTGMATGVRIHADWCCTYGVRWDCVSIYN